MARRGIVAERGHNVVAMRLERVRSAAAAGRKLRDRVALIEILPILRKAAEQRRRGRIPFCGRIERRPLPLSSITFGCRRARN